jgi:hypothetical protein
MNRLFSCLILTCLVSACAPKATEVVETPAPTPRQNSKPAGPATAEVPADLKIVNRGGMVMPDINRLPDQQDMTPTAPPATAGGGVIAIPPAPRKPVSE